MKPRSIAPSPRPRRSWVGWPRASLACCVRAGVEVSLFNVVASTVLLLALAGEVFHGSLAGWWARISEVLYGLATAPICWFGIGELWLLELGFMGLAARAVWVLVPAVFLLILFGAVFADGNAVFAELISRMARKAFEGLARLDLSFERLLFWSCVATLALGLFPGARTRNLRAGGRVCCRAFHVQTTA